MWETTRVKLKRKMQCSQTGKTLWKGQEGPVVSLFNDSGQLMARIMDVNVFLDREDYDIVDRKRIING